MTPDARSLRTAAPDARSLLAALVEALDAMAGKVTIRGTARDSVDLGLAFDAAADEARAFLDAAPAKPFPLAALASCLVALEDRQAPSSRAVDELPEHWQRLVRSLAALAAAPATLPAIDAAYREQGDAGERADKE